MLYIVGIGPGSRDIMTQEAIRAIKQSEVIVGYKTYLKVIEDMLQGKETVSNGMRGEVERCQKAIKIAKKGKTVAMISSGDAGIYGMAGLILELVDKEDAEIEIKVIPGVTASIAAAAKLGAPLMNDFCHISLSDHMTPWKVIKSRIDAAAKADFVICLYNPRSSERPELLKEAMDIITKYKSDETVVGIGKDVARVNETEKVTTIKELNYEEINMTTIVLVGNKHTYIANDRMITPRGYEI
ncbi:precorrin-3B C(17)-methyltransferase [Pediococcus claussenii]|uniref:Precorrin-3B C17-methyltransferase n=1 Tax=Pediococcus claussenii (strain ATCC BAA-344 / DSM 14800 / JCM 18046 / KCTC 3811 / LMG 21948 / P06) TaxID=701521 RepID=G8PEL0_PEDCP|nr:precorrin-3B C(17)-methyltransferase [Pediococcus claussenii]AEV95619.1 precorrin-3B C17-methyltransferase [Pediococcus claussenii ATCC BAA-344]ANZ69139.1 cobalt-precorrin-3B C(17)-methyltransferase [Pediococcus claussenii]ANZ70956.1 cobalt-precorrin-3B C(17)-methyltransferase [Pediococcus claussenii]KRN20148.1 cbiH protein [Pediococcus claussenii]